MKWAGAFRPLIGKIQVIKKLFWLKTGMKRKLQAGLTRASQSSMQPNATAPS
jgi:hypothetical protein